VGQAGGVPLRDVILGVVVGVVWGVNFVVIDEGLPGVPPLLFAALRFTVVVFPAVFFVPRPAMPWRDVALVGLLLSVGQFGLLYTALHLGMPPGIAALVLQAQVVLSVLIAALRLGEPPTRRQLVGVALGVAGLAVVGFGRADSTPALALLLTLGAALSWALGNVVVRRGAVASGLSLTVWSALVVPVPLLAMSLLLDGPAAVTHAVTHLSGGALLSTAYTAYLASLVGYAVWNTLLARHPAASVVPFALLAPPVAMLASWWWQGVTPNLAESLGGVVLLAGVAIAVVRRPRRAAIETVSAVAPDERVAPTR
jgi:O-acetylserine/cysteine efflux transporter